VYLDVCGAPVKQVDIFWLIKQEQYGHTLSLGHHFSGDREKKT
jgi:hypothetical protein